ncbi:MAG: hypothetical protein AAGH92_01665 [Planctomycetota bacterium]
MAEHPPDPESSNKQQDADVEPAVGDAFDDPIDEDAPSDPPGDGADANDDARGEALGDLDSDDEPEYGAAASGGGQEARKPHAVLCPYCGHTQRKRSAASGTAETVKSRTERCDVCGGLFEPLSRKATQIAMGPWFLRDKRNPFRPGCSFEVLEKLINAGQIGPTTVLRGPTTRQFWSIARNVPGVAHRLGYCHACGGSFDPEDLKLDQTDQCPFCETVFKTPRHRNELGLAYPNRKAADSAQRSLDRQLALLSGKDMVGIDRDGQPVPRHPDPPVAEEKPAAPETPPTKPADPTDLLGDVLGIDAPPANRPEDVSPLSFSPDHPEDAEQRAGSGVHPATQGPDRRESERPSVSTDLPDEAPAAAPIAPPHPNQLSPVQPAQPWIIYLLIALNVIVGLGIVAFFVLRPPA